jgi:hypothetical protein
MNAPPETITVDQVTSLLQQAAARDQRIVGEADILAWWSDLNTAHVRYDDAQTALGHYYAEVWPREDPAKRFRATAPVLIEIVLAMRKRRLAESNFVYEPRFGETGAEYVRRLREQTAAVADGLVPPQPMGRVLRVRPVQQMIEGVAAARALPPEIADVLAARRPAANSVTCPYCNAPPKTQCRAASGSAKARALKAPHPGRVDAWVTAVAACPECKAAPGEVCRQMGQPYPHGAHRSRLEAAGAPTAPTQTPEDAAL